MNTWPLLFLALASFALFCHASSQGPSRRFNMVDSSPPSRKHTAASAAASSAPRSASARTLQLLMVVHRHGDRSPVVYYEDDEPRWPDGMGQLTPKGMHQLYELGQWLRSKYVDELGFLPDTYSHFDMQCRATDTDRTLISSEGLLLGLYPNGPSLLEHPEQEALPCHFQPVPVHTVPTQQDYLLRSWYNCEKYQHIYDTQVRGSPEWAAKEQANAALLSEASHYFYDEPQTLDSIWSIVDLMTCEYSHEMEDTRGAPRDLYDRLVLLNDWVVQRQFATGEIGRLIGGHLVWRLREDMRLKSIGEGVRKLHLYSAHDVTVASLLAALNIPVNKLPGYAASLAFEFYSEGNDYLVRALFNREPILIPGCSTEYCRYETFLEATEMASIHDIQGACAVEGQKEEDAAPADESGDNGKLAVPFFGFLFGCVVVFVIAVLVLLFKKRRGSSRELGSGGVEMMDVGSIGDPMDEDEEGANTVGDL
eukprot:TRINITY_DN1302_c0_g1_i1.p1 TRINITY_DN1302_c0_g1~~TRINITY_DN1302_c0_g1_i1.p1  ORF type:complete len:480 (+),score=148.57 TRINITY_DN1302_c0_g1_i1:136-1575(+)